MRVIINADDFGYSGEVNAAIVQAFSESLVSSTTIMPNMPGFEEAVELTKTKGLTGRVGIHLNLFEGSALTEEMKKCKIFVDDFGDFHQRSIQFSAPFKIDRKIITGELFAQIEKVMKTGINPTHLDSHAHRHTNFFIGTEVINLAKHFKIPAIRISSNIRNDKLSNIKADLYNLRLKIRGIKAVNYLGSIPVIAACIEHLSGNVEVISHPVYKNGLLTDLEYSGELKDLLTSFLRYEAISYKDI